MKRWTRSPCWRKQRVVSFNTTSVGEDLNERSDEMDFIQRDTENAKKKIKQHRKMRQVNEQMTDRGRGESRCIGARSLWRFCRFVPTTKINV